MTHLRSCPHRSNGLQEVSPRKIEVKTAQVDAVQENALSSLGRVEFPHSLDPKRKFKAKA